MLNLVSYGFLSPPTIFILLCLVGAVVAPRWRRAGMLICLLSSLCLFVAATPAFSTYLLRRIESALPPSPDFSAAQAIVVLGGDVRSGNGGDIPDTLGPISLERVMLAATAARRLHLPIAVSGNGVARGHVTEAELMRATLEEQFGLTTRWSDERSHTTWQNALFTAALLRPDKIDTVILVTQAWHLPRAIWCFEHAGLKALPWPAPRTMLRADGFGDFMPSAAAFHDTFRALHELIGAAYYRMRY
jgi:uncharacterized SAM-binding protein YcdF (DUF218 family)